jgi:hypothetical protein
MTIDKMLEIIQAFKEGKNVQRRKLTTNVKDTMFRNARASRWEDVTTITEFNFSYFYDKEEPEVSKYEYRIKREFKLIISKEEEEAVALAEKVVNGTIVTDADEKKSIIKDLLYYYRCQKSHALNYGQLYYNVQDKLADLKSGISLPKEPEPECEG